MNDCCQWLLEEPQVHYKLRQLAWHTQAALLKELAVRVATGDGNDGVAVGVAVACADAVDAAYDACSTDGVAAAADVAVVDGPVPMVLTHVMNLGLRRARMRPVRLWPEVESNEVC